MILSDLIEHYLLTLPLKPESGIRHLTALKLFFKYRNHRFTTRLKSTPNLTVQALTRQIAEFKIQIEHHKPSTQYGYLGIIKRFLRFLAVNHYTFWDLSEELNLIPYFRERKKRRVPTNLNALLKAILKSKNPDKYRDLAILALNYTENLTCQVISELTVIDLDLVVGELRIIRQKRFKSLQKSTLTYLKGYLKSRNTSHPKTATLFLCEPGSILKKYRRLACRN